MGGSVQKRLFGNRVPALELDRHKIPSTTGVYCWWHGDEPLFVGVAEDLHHQLVVVETGPRRDRVPIFRQFLRQRVQEQGRLGIGEDRPTIRAAVDHYIAECAVSWTTTRSFINAEEFAEKAREKLLGEAEPWQERAGEDQWLRRYLDELDEPGRVYVEVAVGAATGPLRRIDAVRFPGLTNEVKTYSPHPFVQDLRRADEMEIIEVKRRLNRTVIGQLLVARDLAAQEWSWSPSLKVTLVALVTVVDPALEGFCMRHGIRVKKVQREKDDTDIEA
jgi:hypothetical protein